MENGYDQQKILQLFCTVYLNEMINEILITKIYSKH